MKRLKLFPKTFLYSMGLMLLVILIAHLLLYLLTPQMVLDFRPVAENGVLVDASVNTTSFVVQAIRKALPISLSLCILLAIGCSLLFSKALTGPIQRISAAAERMMHLEKAATCPVHSQDEIGVLAEHLNHLYGSLLSTIQNLEEEKERVRESERSKADFLRAASHELKTPVTALNATLENMLLGVGKYRDYDTYLPECKELVERLSHMLHEILETSRAGLADGEPAQTLDLAALLTSLCQPYQLIAQAHGVQFNLETVPVAAALPPRQFGKVVSNLLANAVAYTEPGHTVSVTLNRSALTIENECAPIPEAELSRLFEPFYRPDFSRSRDSGGNGLGLYIVDTLLGAMGLPYTFEPMEKPGDVPSPGMRFTIRLADS